MTRVATVAAATAALEKAAHASRFAGLVVDHGLPDGNGFDVVAVALGLDPLARIVMLTGTWDKDIVAHITELGGAYLLKATDDDLLALVGPWRTPDLRRARVAEEWATRHTLSAAEANILEAACQSLDREVIAQRTGCALATVNSHVARLLRKTGRDTLQQLVVDVMNETLARS